MRACHNFTATILASGLLSLPAFAAVPVFVETLANECRFDEALRVFDATAHPFPRTAEERAFIRARLLLKLGRYEEIVSSTDLSQTEAEPVLLRGLALASIGRRGDALRVLSQADSLGAWDYADAEDILVPLLRLAPPLSSALYNLACIRSSQNRLTEAAALIRRAWEIGWQDVRHLRNDPDLEPLRRSGLIGDLLIRDQPSCSTW